MSGRGIEITRAGPIVTVQDGGRPGMLRYGIAASGAMDRTGFDHARQLAGGIAQSGVEIGAGGVDFTCTGGKMLAGFSGGMFALSVNGKARKWGAAHGLTGGDRVSVKPGKAGNFGYICFDGEIGVPMVMGSRSTNLLARIGGLAGRTLAAGDRLELAAPETRGEPLVDRRPGVSDGPLRVVWGLHADLFSAPVRERFAGTSFKVTGKMDRTGIGLSDENGVFAGLQKLSLVSDAVVPGDVQILGDGTPVVLMRDHQPTGGYPRIATVVSDDLDRLAQMRPGTEVRFMPVKPDNLSR